MHTLQGTHRHHCVHVCLLCCMCVVLHVPLSFVLHRQRSVWCHFFQLFFSLQPRACGVYVCATRTHTLRVPHTQATTPYNNILYYPCAISLRGVFHSPLAALLPAAAATRCRAVSPKNLLILLLCRSHIHLIHLPKTIHSVTHLSL